MLSFGVALRAHNPYLGYEGDFDEAASSCFKTAFVFAILAAISALSFVGDAVRSKMSPSAVTNSGYQAV